MTREEALDIICKNLWLYEELMAQSGKLLEKEYYEARDKIVPEYAKRFHELSDWWRKEEVE